jgi:hypothetical protein
VKWSAVRPFPLRRRSFHGNVTPLPRLIARHVVVICTVLYCTVYTYLLLVQSWSQCWAPKPEYHVGIHTWTWARLLLKEGERTNACSCQLPL